MFAEIKKTREAIKETGLKKKDISRKLAIVKKVSDFSSYDFFRFKLYYISDEYLEIKCEEIKSRLEREKARNEKTLAYVSGKTQWTKEQVADSMNRIKREFGINTDDYVYYRLFDLEENALKSKCDEIKALKAEAEKQSAERIKANSRRFVTQVVKATGWNRRTAVANMKETRSRTGASFQHYAVFMMWNLTEEEQSTYFVKRENELLRKKYNRESTTIQELQNKDLFCARFDKYLGRPWMSSFGNSFDEFDEIFKDVSKIIYKPRASFGGKGVCVFELNPENRRQVYDEISTLPPGIVEGFIRQHPKMQQLSKQSVNTIRVVTIRTLDDTAGIETDKVHIIYAGLRMGAGDSIVDNLHVGGAMADINLETGIVQTHGVDYANRVHEKHPDTGTVIKGFEVPYFDKVKELVTEAGAGVEGYFGWDIAIAEDGPVVIEINTNPSPVCIQTQYAPDKIGKKYLFDDYLR